MSASNTNMTPEQREARRAQRARERARKKKILTIVSCVVFFLALAIVVLLILFVKGKIDADNRAVMADSVQDFQMAYAGDKTTFDTSSGSGGAQSTDAASTQDLPSIDTSVLRSSQAYMERLSDSAQVFDQGGDDRIYPASMTKIMTAILGMEHLDDLSKTYTFTGDEFADWAEATMAGFAAGDEATYTDILHGIMLPSGSDASHAIAIAVAGSDSAFVDMMNQKAQEIGMANTHFTNVTGLQDADHYSTCKDIAKLLQYAMKNDQFRAIMGSHSYTTAPLKSNAAGLTFTSTLSRNGFTYDLDNGVLIEGGKTGFTDEAGHCLASAAKTADGTEYILVTAGAAGGADEIPQLQDADDIYSQLPQA